MEGIFFLGGVLKFQIFLGVLEISFFFWGGGRTVDAGPEPTYEEKNESTPPPPWTVVWQPLNRADSWEVVTLP